MTAKKNHGQVPSVAGKTGARPPTIGFAGRSGFASMAPSDVQLAQQVRQTVWELASHSRVTGTRLDSLALATVRNRHRRAVDVLGREPILAVLRRPGPGACSWCAARVLCAANGQPQPTPTPALDALLGTQCSRCKAAFQAAGVAGRERREGTALQAAGGLRRRVTGPQPTGAIWPAGKEPPGLTAAARRAARRAADPPCYTPNRRRPRGE